MGRNPPRNQSAHHFALCQRCLPWFASRSTRRGIHGALEVRVADGYVCDALAIGAFQDRFIRNYAKRSGLERRGTADDVWAEWCELACVFEIKVTRADFLSTFSGGPKHENRHVPLGSLHWCVTPRGLIQGDELPEWWGLLEQSGGGLAEQKSPRLFKIGEATLHSFAYELLWKRGSSTLAPTGASDG